MELINVTIDNKEYTLVDIYSDIIDKTVYHFMSDDDERFYYKDNDKMTEITNPSVINILFNYLGYNDETGILYKETETDKRIKELTKGVELSQEEELLLKQRVVELICKKKGLDKQLLIEAMKNTKIIISTSDNGIADGTYFAFEDKIVIYTGNITRNEDLEANKIHELIHSITFGFKKIGIISQIWQMINREVGFVEGATESLVEELCRKKSSHTSISMAGEELTYNMCSDNSYKIPISIIRQMEVAIGKNSSDTVLKKTNDLFETFRNEYGSDLYRFLKHRTNRTRNMNDCFIDEKKAKYIEETQDILLQRIIKKDLLKIKSITDANKFIKKIKEIGQARISIKGRDRYEELYNKALKEVVLVLNKLNISKEEIENFLSENTFVKPKLYPKESIEDREQIDKHVKKSFNTFFTFERVLFEQDISEEELKKIKAYYGKDKLRREFVVFSKNNDIIGGCIKKEGDQNVFQIIKNINDRVLGKHIYSKNGEIYIYPIENGEILLEEYETCEDFENFAKVVQLRYLKKLKRREKERKGFIR